MGATIVMGGVRQDSVKKSWITMKSDNKAMNSGFSVLELSAVILMAGFVLVGIIGMYDQYQKANYLNATRGRQAAIVKALQDFFNQNGYLPCAASKTLPQSSPMYGRGDNGNDPLHRPKQFPVIASVDCATPAGGTVAVGGVHLGYVPVRSLDLPDSYAVNPNNYPYIYAVTDSVAQYTLAHPATPTSPTIDMTSGKIDIQYPVTHASMVSPPGSALYTVIDPGPTGCGGVGLNADAVHNCTTTTTFYYGSAATYVGN